MLKLTILRSGIQEKKRKNPTFAYKGKDTIQTFNVRFGILNFQKDAV